MWIKQKMCRFNDMKYKIEYKCNGYIFFTKFLWMGVCMTDNDNKSIWKKLINQSNEEEFYDISWYLYSPWKTHYMKMEKSIDIIQQTTAYL